MRWIAGGIVGWLAAVVPLLGVNIAGYANVFDTDTAVIAGAFALIGGILLGGLVTGLIAGRPSAEQPGGTARALPAGILAALLYSVSLIAVVMVAINIQAAPTVVADHPIRITVAIVCLGALLLGVSLLSGVLMGRRGGKHISQPSQRPQPQAPARYPTQQSMSRPQTPGQPARGAYPDTNYPDRANQRDYDSQGRASRSYDEHPPARHPSGSSSRSSGIRAGQDTDWREDWR